MSHFHIKQPLVMTLCSWASALFFMLMLSSCGAGSDRSALVLTVQAEEEGREGDLEFLPESETAQAAATGAGNQSDAAFVPSKEGEEQSPQTADGTNAEIVVHVCGAVNHEGVYKMEAGSRVYEAVAMAGGFSSDADEAYINQAEVLSDASRLRIPTKEETAALAEHGSSADAPELSVITKGAGEAAGDSTGETLGASSGKVNINTADAELLSTLGGIGPSTAAKIIAWRELNGRFQSIEDIMQVSGIKEKLFSKIKDDITVN